MTRQLLIIVLFICGRLNSQTTIKSGYTGPFHIDETWVLVDKKNVQSLFPLNDPDNILQLKEVAIGDTTVLFFGNDPDFKRKLTFKYADLCDFDQLIFKDSTAAGAYLKRIIGLNRHGWKKIKNNYYLSKNKFKLELVIADNCVTYRRDTLTSKERKQLTRQHNGT